MRTSCDNLAAAKKGDSMCPIVVVDIYDFVTLNHPIMGVHVKVSAMLSMRKQHRPLLYCVLCTLLISSSL